MKDLKWASLLTAFLYIIGGFLMLLFPGKVALFACIVIGAALIIYGVIDIILYFMLDLSELIFRNEFVNGVVWIMLGFMVIHYRLSLQKMMPLILGVALIASGFGKVQNGIVIHRLNASRAQVPLLLGAISMVFGMVVLFGKLHVESLLFQIIGAGMLYSGASDLYLTLYISGKVKQFCKAHDVPIARIQEAKNAEHVQDTDVQ
ncbi:MAG: HdeD family acid-resistance protein [Bulleidia sp.]